MNTALVESAFSNEIHFVASYIDSAPAHYALLQNYPNPFNPVTQILYTLPQDGHVHLAIYDLRGQRVALLVDERQAAGQHSAVWQAQEHSSGVYFIKLQAGGLLRVRKAVLMK